MEGALIFTSCTKRKCDSVPIGEQKVEPNHYIGDPLLLQKLLATRHLILSKPEAKAGTSETYAFDLYVQTGRAYRQMHEQYYAPLKHALLHETIPARWFFLSGGYGIVAAFEPASYYQATFRNQKGVFCTGKLWQPSLTRICEHVVNRHNGWKVYVFGSQAYTEFLKHSRLPSETKIIESTASAGSTRLSPVIAAFASALLSHDLPAFDKEYPERFTKLP